MNGLVLNGMSYKQKQPPIKLVEIKETAKPKQTKLKQDTINRRENRCIRIRKLKH